MSSRKVIYEEPATRTLQSAVRQVVQTSSFYNTTTTTTTAMVERRGKRSSTINSDHYNSEIIEDDDDDAEDVEHLYTEQQRRRTHRRHSSEERRKRPRRSSSESSVSGEEEKSSKDRQRRSPSEEGEESESNEEETETIDLSPVREEPAPIRSRFDDPDGEEEDDDDEEEEEEDDRNRHHKRSRRRSTSSSSSASAPTPPRLLLPEPIEEKPKLPSYYPAIQGCRRVDEYKCLNRIEEGTYGVVFRAKDIKTDEIVALKRLKMEKEKEGFPITSLREICCILKSQHENVCTVREIVVGEDMNRIFIVMDYVEHDLKGLMTHTMKKPFSIGEVKTLMYQLLAGVNHLHDNWIIHRDLKTSNLLLSNKGILKIGDFGLAREYGSPLKPYTPVVVTLWYRAPELLLGIQEYSTPIDMWSVGAIFGELLLMKPLFPGKSELDQLNRIFKDLGTPNEKIWPNYNSLPFTKKMNFSNYPYNRLRTRFDASLSEKGFDLINKFLTYDPSKRISALDALKHAYFDESPRRIDPSMFPTWPSRNEEKDKVTSMAHQRASGSNKATTQNEPKPPSGGKMYEQLLGAGDDETYSLESNLPPPSGFQLRG